MKATIDKALPEPIQIKDQWHATQLQRASAVLSCLAVATDEGVELDVSDIAIVARDIVDHAVDTLDPMNLTGVLCPPTQ